MQKLYFSDEGWVCERYPYNIPLTETFIEVEDDVYYQTFTSDEYFAWRVVDGNIVQVRYEDTPEEVVLNELRKQREVECFSVINQNYIIDGQSKTWFDTLTEEQKQDANIWVQQWRDVTETKVVPTKPSWLN